MNNINVKTMYTKTHKISPFPFDYVGKNFNKYISKHCFGITSFLKY